MPSTHHEFVVRREKKEAVPKNKHLVLNVGDTVKYTSPHGEVRILFKDDRSPFVGPGGAPMLLVEGDTIVTVRQSGEFKCGCNIKLATGKVIGWNPKKPEEHPDSGGIHDVRD